MEKRKLKNHTCNPHFQCDGQVSLKGMDLSSLKNALLVLHVFASMLLEIGQPCSEYGSHRGGSSLWKFTIISKFQNKTFYFYFNIVISMSRIVKNHPSIALVLHKCRAQSISKLWLIEISISLLPIFEHEASWDHLPRFNFEVGAPNGIILKLFRLPKHLFPLSDM